MAYVTNLLNTNFLEYASYVIKDRAIPHLDDGLKPVQRRILHSLFEMDDGKFHKVANVTGHCMKYHPHGDASIYSALVVLANKDIFIEKQGNFGNILTGDEASAPRYIECRITPLARRVLYNPEITQYEDSYDGRNKEPVTFPAKIPVILIQGAEGIAVGMSTKILPHNFVEVLQAVIAALRGQRFQLYPDFPSGGLMDVSEYQEGNGKVTIRGLLDTKDPKRIVIREIPFGTTTESLIASIEAAAKKNKIKIAGINDFTTEQVEIEVALARGVYATETVDSLYAFTDCQLSTAVNLLIIEGNRPVTLTITEVIKHHAKKLIEILKAELSIEERTLKDRLHAKTLEQIFIEERIYKGIEQMETQGRVLSAVHRGLRPFASKIRREVTDEDVDRLLKIPIRRISLYDINKARDEMREIKNRLKEIAYHLDHLIDYAVGFLDGLVKEYGSSYPRRTKIVKFNKVDVREAAQRHLELRYDAESGYLGYEVKSGKVLFNVSDLDRVLVVRKSGVYSVIDVPEKLFVDKGMLACGFADKETLAKTVFTVVYRQTATGHPFLKRCTIEGYIKDKGYMIVPEDCEVLKLTTQKEGEIILTYKPKPRLKVTEERFRLKDFPIRGVKTLGARLSTRDVEKAAFRAPATKGAEIREVTITTLADDEVEAPAAATPAKVPTPAKPGRSGTGKVAAGKRAAAKRGRAAGERRGGAAGGRSGGADPAGRGGRPAGKPKRK